MNTGFLDASCGVFLTQVFTIGQLAVYFAYGLTVQLESMHVVDHAIKKNGIGERVCVKYLLTITVTRNMSTKVNLRNCEFNINE